MQKYFWSIISAVVLVILPTAVLSQPSNPSIIPVSTAPSGSCAQGLPNQQVSSTGAQYSCQNGVWGQLSMGSSGSFTTISATTSSTSPKYIGSSTAFSCTPGASSGTGATCVCETNHVCTTSSGDLTITTGTSTTTGTAATVVLYGSAQSSYPNCSVEAHTASAVSTVAYTLENSTGFTRYAFGAPAASTVYTLHYQCGY